MRLDFMGKLRINFLWLILALCTVRGFSQSTFINEINYLASNPDDGLEIAGPANTVLDGYTVIIYNTLGVDVTSLVLSGTISDQQNGHGVIWYDIEQGSNQGGIALLNPSNVVVQFLSYGPVVTVINAVQGLANGATSTYIGEQTSSANSLQLQGSGVSYTDFTWGLPGGITEDAINAPGQTFNPALPVELIGFSAKEVERGILLQWSTATEIDNQEFVIEKSTDGKNFLDLQSIPGAGQTDQRRDYQFLDKSVNAPLLYYRLRQVDFDGSIHRSKIVVVQPKDNHVDVNVQFDADQSLLHIDFDHNLNRDGTLSLFDLKGSLIYQYAIDKEANFIDLNIDPLAKGAYILHIKLDSKVHSELIIRR